MQILLFQVLCSPVWVEFVAEVSDADIRPRHGVRYIWVKADAEWPWDHALYPVLCTVMADSFNPMDCSPSGSSAVRRVFQARILEWVAISFSRGSFEPRNGTHVSWVSYIGRQFFTTGKSMSPALFVSTPLHLLETCPETGKVSDLHDKWKTSTMDYFFPLIS